VDKPVIFPIEGSMAATGDFFRRVYNWMGAGLALTGLVAFFTATSPAMLQLVLGNRWMFYGLIIAQVGMVIGLSAAINRLTALQATLLFCAYAALSGLTFASIFVVYTASSIASTFFITAGTFATMSVYAHVTKRDLTSWGSFLFMGLIGVVIASVVNIFLESAMVTWVVSCIGVLVFTGLTAYDAWSLKQMARYGFADEETARKAGIIGALKLYLDFINLFLMLLNLLGDRR